MEAGAAHPQAWPRSWIFKALAALLLPWVLLCWMEGCTSGWLVIDAALEAIEPEPPRISRYDAELGWTAMPGLRLEDAWGQGRAVHTNSRGFRGAAEVEDAAVPGRIRVLCSGDSFTFGEGVADDRTWCSELARLEPGVEAVNLAMPGYGVDQAFLRFRRDAGALRHDLHLFAFIGGDLRRAEAHEMFGYGKPRLTVADGELQVTNVPVPRWMPMLGRIAANVRGSLRMVDFARRARVKVAPPQAPQHDDQPFESMLVELSPVLEKMFDEVSAQSRRNGGLAVFVYLPVKPELEEPGVGVWRRWCHATFARRPEPLIDLTDALRADPGTHYDYFIREQAPAEGHYSELGNERIARLLREALLANPETAARLQSSAAPLPPGGG
jgi:hypothetical protein